MVLLMLELSHIVVSFGAENLQTRFLQTLPDCGDLINRPRYISLSLEVGVEIPPATAQMAIDILSYFSHVCGAVNIFCSRSMSCEFRVAFVVHRLGHG